MRVRLGNRRWLLWMSVAASVGLAEPAGAMGAVKFTRVGTIPGVGGPVEGVTRTSDGTLHVVFPTSQNGAQGLTSTTISSSGSLGPSIQALSTAWGLTPSGLVALPGDTLEVVFGAIWPVNNQDGIWGSPRAMAARHGRRPRTSAALPRSRPSPTTRRSRRPCRAALRS